MGRKDFNADLQQAKKASFSNVSCVQAGESDGLLAFTFCYPDLRPLEVVIMAKDIDAYPGKADYFLFVASDEPDPHIVSFLQDLVAFSNKKTLPQIVHFVSANLTAHLVEPWGESWLRVGILRIARLRRLLLIKTTGGYPIPEIYIQNRLQAETFQFELGPCEEAKPTAASAEQVFQTSRGRGLNDTRKGAFEPFYMFQYISRTLTNDLPALLHRRRQNNVSWLAALHGLRSYGGKTTSQACAAPWNDTASQPLVLQQDHALEPLGRLSIPLVAMQHALQLLLRCGRYCVNCYRAMDDGFQSMRPYVCDIPLCLDHYVSLNQGPGIEHEIIHSPYVVDLPPARRSQSFGMPDADEPWSLNMYAYAFCDDLYSLEPDDRPTALTLLTLGIPSVLRMREFLLAHPDRLLSDATEIIDQNTYRLLLWIVASNRSLIGQDDLVPPAGPVAEGSNSQPNKVLGAPKGWLQFRFVQGSPEKEQRFRMNGRSFGDGVYLSKIFNTSMIYSLRAAPSETWPTSVLRVNAALSICELVNRLDPFIAKHPHFVVDHIEWIQYRFLLAQVSLTDKARQLPFPTPPKRSSEGYIRQDPEMTPLGPNGLALRIPTFDEALPLARDMKAKRCNSIMLEVFAGADYRLTPPFVRVVRPLFLEFARGGGDHVTTGGAICAELLTSSGWSPALSIEKALFQVRLDLCDTERPARLRSLSASDKACYSISEAVRAYKRVANTHGWEISTELATMASAWVLV
ncbi:uncharacterized protein J7T54_005399 [Emericellopsis cladophorae]|uniref:UBC core domain-containing protein n=1 Tax=Emericellopsis cladophorae TaxID=2686198 RepID=A0A9P9XYQ2_9HYPO|nr:uncharacterized protein J7T54_005399 [Emericellopsis cladophorae]KAI6780297.1 hypothetical protein J7T54_005399 [Emericellopsis cladophorae]